MVLVAITKGLGETFSFDNLKVNNVRESCISNILDPIPLDDDRWKRYEYLAEKEIRDKAAGKGFRRQLLTGKEDGCGVIGRHYFKGRSTEPFLIHPVRPELSRLFTKGEHARIKGIPQEILNGVSETTAQEMAGQSVGYGQFESVGEEIGGCLLPVRNNILKFPKPQQALDKLEDDKHSAPFVVQIGTMSLFN